MKKFTILMLCIVTLGLASCKKEALVTPNNLTIVKYINPNDWQSSANRFTLSASLIDSRIDLRTLEDDGILVYVSRGDNGVYEQLPFTYDTQAYSYAASEGRIDIDLQSSDFQEAIPDRPSTVTRVKIVLIESYQ